MIFVGLTWAIEALPYSSSPAGGYVALAGPRRTPSLSCDDRRHSNTSHISVGSFAASTVQVPASGCARRRRFPGVPATALPGDSAENVTAPITSASPSNCAWFGGAPEKAAITIEATGTRFMKMAVRTGPSLAIPAFQNRYESTPPPTDIASKAAPARRSGTTKAGPLSSATAVKATAPVVMIPAVLAMPLVSVGTSLRTYTL